MKRETYTSQVTLPAAPQVNALADPAIGGLVGNAIARGADEVGSAVTRWGVNAEHARRMMQTATMTTDAMKEMDQVEQSLEGDPDWSTKQQKYDDALARIRANHVEDSANDPAVQQIFARDFDRLAQHRSAAFHSDVRRQTVDDLTSQLDTALADFTTQAVNARTPQERADVSTLANQKIDLAAEGGIIPKVKAEAIRKNWLGGVDDAVARRAINDDPHAAAAALKGSELFPHLDPSQREVLLEHATLKAKAADGEVQAEAEKGRQQQLSDLTIAVSTGEAGVKAIDAAYQDGKGWLKPHERTALTLAADRLDAKQNEVAAGVARVGAALAGDGVLDPKSDKDRKGVDYYFDRVVAPDVAKMEPDAASTKLADFVIRTGVMPDVVRGQVRGSLRAGDDAKAAAAADLIDRVGTNNPQVLNDLSDEDLVLGRMIASSVRAGVEPATAVREARDALKRPEAERKVLERKMSDEKQPQANDAWLNSKLTGGSKAFVTAGLADSLPGNIPPAMSADFGDLYKNAYLRSADVDVARQVALDRLNNVWGVSKIGGGRWMRYAPEAIYGNDKIGTAWIGEQLLADLKKDSLWSKPIDGRVFLEADAQTAREMASGTPAYQVLVKNDQGAFEPMRDAKGAPMRWRPDFASSPAGEREAKLTPQLLDRARGDRAKQEAYLAYRAAQAAGKGPNGETPADMFRHWQDLNPGSAP